MKIITKIIGLLLLAPFGLNSQQNEQASVTFEAFIDTTYASEGTSNKINYIDLSKKEIDKVDGYLKQFFIDLFFHFLVLVGIFYIQRALNNIMKMGAFNNKLDLFLKKGGVFLIISGSCGFLINVVMPLFKFKRNPLDMFLGNDFLILIIGP